jgi:hypothetical protein
MAIPTTLLAFWTAQKTTAANTLKAAQAALTAAQTNLGAQRAGLSTANQELVDLKKEEARIRAELAAAPTVVDGEALLVELGAARTAVHAKEAEILKIEASLDAAQTDLDQANTKATEAVSQLAEAAVAVKTAEQKDKDRASLKTSLTEPPLVTMPADATAALTAKPYTDAKVRLAADIPEELLDCARKRARVQRVRLAHDTLKSKEVGTLILDAGSEVEKKWEGFRDAVEALSHYVLNAKRQFDTALTVLKRVADPEQNLLTEPEMRAIQSKLADGTTNAELKEKRLEAVEKAQAVATAQAAYDAKEVLLIIARMKAKTKDVDADPESDPDVIVAKAELATALTAVDAARNEFTAGMKADLAAWEAAVPDNTWRLIADFDEAERWLNDLKVNQTSLESKTTDAEKELVAVLVSADKNARTLQTLQNEAAKAAALAKFDAGALPRRVLGAMRGDS